jgi:heterodisulfide reductase subunit A
VFFCRCRGETERSLDLEKLEEYTKKIPGVVITSIYSDFCSANQQQQFIHTIVTHRLNRVLICACSPQRYEEVFKGRVVEAGLHKHFLLLVNIREHISWPHVNDPKRAQIKALAAIRAGIAKIKLVDEIPVKVIDLNKSVLIIGAGETGINAAKALASQGYKIYLIEKSSAIGGKTTRWSREFPTDECSPCSVQFDLREIISDPNIETWINTTVYEISGRVGDFTVKVKKIPRHVDISKCSACGACAKVCPHEVLDEYEFGITKRKIIYLPFPQAYPSKYLIDDENKDKCIDCSRPCLRVCPNKAINLKPPPAKEDIFLEKEGRHILTVGAIIAAIGFDVYEPALNEFGYGTNKNIITTYQLERFLCDDGPTKGRLFRITDGKVPKRIAFIQCVGSRDKKHPYCSKYCCMTTLKNVRQLKELINDLAIDIYYKDLITHGLEFENYLNEIKSYPNINFINYIPTSWRITEDQQIILEIPELNKETKFDMVILATGMIPHSSTNFLGDVLGVDRNIYGFFKCVDVIKKPLETYVPGIYIAGCCTGPKILRDSVSEGLAVASNVAQLLKKGVLEIELKTCYVTDEKKCGLCGSCLRTCHFEAAKIDIMRKKAYVDELICRNCGNCVVACPTGAREIRLYTSEIIKAQLQEIANTTKNEKIKILCFACDYCGYVAADNAGSLGYSYPAYVHILRVPCMGCISTEYPLEAIRHGIDGVILVGCKEGACHNVRGNIDSIERLRGVKKVLQFKGISPNRVKFIGVSEGYEFQQKILKFVKVIKNLSIRG